MAQPGRAQRAAPAASLTAIGGHAPPSHEDGLDIEAFVQARRSGPACQVGSRVPDRRDRTAHDRERALGARHRRGLPAGLRRAPLRGHPADRHRGGWRRGRAGLSGSGWPRAVQSQPSDGTPDALGASPTSSRNNRSSALDSRRDSTTVKVVRAAWSTGWLAALAGRPIPARDGAPFPASGDRARPPGRGQGDAGRAAR